MKKLQSDVVRIAQGDAGAIAGLLDAAVRDPDRMTREPSYDDVTSKLRRVIVAARFRSQCLSRRSRNGPSRPRSLGRSRDMINQILRSTSGPVGASNSAHRH
jgi:hypothetical protein